MKILLISDFFPPVRGGLEGHVDRLASELVALGHQLHVATLTPETKPTCSDVQVHTVQAASTRLLPHVDARRPFHPPLPDPVARRQLADIVSAVRPDVIHGHSWLTVSLPRQRSTPVVLTSHDYGLACPKRTLMRPDKSQCDGPSIACVPCGREQYGAVKSLLMAGGTPIGRSRMPVDAYIAVSAAVRDLLQPRTSKRIDVIPNFIPSTYNLSGSIEELPSTPFALFAGDPSVHKGLEVLLDAWALRKSRASTLVLAPSRPFERSLPDGVQLAWLATAEMPRAWAAASVAVVPSIWPDPFPTVVLEAMAVGTPVVASDTGGIRDMFTDGEQGFRVPVGDAQQLIQRVEELLADEVLRRRMGAAGQAHVERFRAATVVPQIVEVYAREIAAARR